MTDQTTSVKKGDKRGVSLRGVNAIMIAVVCVLSLILLYATYRTNAAYDAMREDTDRYIACQQDAALMQTASDYLTNEVRSFAVTGDPKHIENFFQEIHTDRRREKALADLGEYFSGAETYAYLRDAFERSNELVNTELYSMRLMAEAQGYDLEAFPPEIQAVTLAPEDAVLSPEEKAERALAAVFDENYQDQKDGISADVASCLETLTAAMRTRQQESADWLQRVMRWQGVLVGILLLSVFAVVVLTVRLVIRPLEKSVLRIRDEDRLPMEGARELRFLAETYNAMFEQTRDQRDQLSYDATHDDLTGLYNRGVFERMRQTCDPAATALILVDVDKFKEINDTYGHEVGDRVLKKVASLLQSGFRSDDYVCRIGGDEFAILMVNVTSAQRMRIYNKLQYANTRLQNPEDDLPPVSLSVGVAFGDRENPTDDIYKDADTALYRVKNGGRGDCAFY